MTLTMASGSGWMGKAFSDQESSLVWLPEVGIGHFPVKQSDMPYDESYFLKYRQQADTEIGRALTKARIELVARHYDGEVLDVGIGCGQFVDSRAGTLGYDVNPAGVKWLRERGCYRDLYFGQYSACTFWDSLEHISDPPEALAHVKSWAFVSLPIFDDAGHCLRSKHFRRDEHIWYFEDRGIRWWFERQGFECVESNNAETEIGREGIGSYAFRRVS